MNRQNRSLKKFGRVPKIVTNVLGFKPWYYDSSGFPIPERINSLFKYRVLLAVLKAFFNTSVVMTSTWLLDSKLADS